MRVFICGLISGGGTLSAAEIEANLARFQAAEEALLAEGHELYRPSHHVPGLMAPSTDRKTWAGYLRRDIRALVDCDAVCPLPGWEGSEGARLEMGIARALGMPEVPLPEGLT